MRRDTAGGFVLLEAMVALAILGGAGLVLVGIVNDALRLESEARRREVEVLAADRVLIAMSLLGRSDLDRRLGLRDAIGLIVDVSRPTASVYRIAVTPQSAPGAPTLITLVYRP